MRVQVFSRFKAGRGRVGRPGKNGSLRVAEKPGKNDSLRVAEKPGSKRGWIEPMPLSA